ncbi:MAG: hypothetical protein MZU97_08690 [Bacillus subtilis]|nr:hypothetical protein [Bacillus subtilis]
MYQKDKTLTEDAEKRLKVIKEFTELGSGFKIAVRDLSIRGAGDVLGSEQSGFIDSVGIELYMKILQEEISERQGGTPKNQPIAHIKAQVSRYIDAKYVEDDFVKLEMHAKINAVQHLADVAALLEEFADRFGDYQSELELFLYEKVFERACALLDVEKLLEAKTNVTLIVSSEGTKRLGGRTDLQSRQRGLQVSSLRLQGRPPALHPRHHPSHQTLALHDGGFPRTDRLTNQPRKRPPGRFLSFRRRNPGIGA